MTTANSEYPVIMISKCILQECKNPSQNHVAESINVPLWLFIQILTFCANSKSIKTKSFY
jgi:hypothetical protein